MASKLDANRATQVEHDDVTGGKIVQPVQQWSASHAPAANTKATASQVAVVGKRHFCRSIAATIAAGATAPTAGTVTLTLRDGATGAGTILWQVTLGVTATAGATTTFALSGLCIAGSTNTAMTLEFSAAGGANTLESVSMTGFDTV